MQAKNLQKPKSFSIEQTTQQWETIYKGGAWDDGTPDYTVHCADGDLKKRRVSWLNRHKRK